MKKSRLALVVAAWTATVTITLLSVPIDQAPAHDGDIDHYTGHLRRAAGQLSQQTKRGDKEARLTLEAIETVTLPDGTALRPDHSTLDTGPAGANRLRALVREIERRSVPLETTGRAPAELEKVLSRAEFEDANEPWYLRWIYPVVDAFFRAALFILRIGAITWAVGLAAVALLVMGLRYIARSTGQRAAADARVGEMIEEETQIRPAEFQGLAQQAARSRDYREAVRLLYLGFLAELREREMVDERRAFTNWEYVRQIRASGRQALAEKAESATRMFEIKWYGKQNCNKADYEQLKAWCRI